MVRAQSLRRHARWLVPLALIIVVFSYAFYLRAVPASLSIADSWAENSVHSFYRNQIEQQINRQFPNLPAQNKQKLVDAEFAKVLEQNRDVIAQQIRATAEQFRSQFKDPTGQTYLLGIDPYYYYRQTRNLLTLGTIGTEERDGEPYDLYKLAPLGAPLERNLHPYVGAAWYKVLSIFSDISVMGAFLTVGALISALSIIPAFFIGRKVGGNVGGFFAAWFTAVNIFFVSRTAGESSDTDAYTILLPLLIAWVFLEALSQKDWKRQLGLMALSGFLVGLFAFAWSGWMFIFYILLATQGALLAYHALLSLWKKQPVKMQLLRAGALAGTFALLSITSTVLFTSFHEVSKLWRGLIGFVEIKSVATTKIWPNVLTTVAELNPASLSSVISQLGGTFLLMLAVIGMLLALLRKDREGRFDPTYALLFGLWLVTTLWATSRGVRFTLLAVPAIAVGLGLFCGLAYQYLVTWIHHGMHVNRVLVQAVVVALLLLLIVKPTRDSHSQATHVTPAVSDGWWDALTKIKDSSKPDAIITSWWDFGHWFKAIADRPVTFDGGNQNTPQAHWVGKLLLTSDENVSFGILRMLDCGGNRAFEEVDKNVHSIPRSVDLLNEVIVLSRDGAAQLLARKGFTAAETESVLRNTHCQPPEGFVIASDDMIGKSGVWGHFGAWDFWRAAMAFRARRLPAADAESVLVSEFNLTPERARSIYQDMLQDDPNKWIAPWPSYQGGFNPCDANNETILCRIRTGQENSFIPVLINRSTMNATIPSQNGGHVPNSLTFATPRGVENIAFDGRKVGFSVILVPQGKDQFAAIIADPLQANSMFTKMYFYEGHGLRCFDPFDGRQHASGGRVLIFKTDWDCLSTHYMFFREEAAADITAGTNS